MPHPFHIINSKFACRVRTAYPAPQPARTAWVACRRCNVVAIAVARKQWARAIIASQPSQVAMTAVVTVPAERAL